MDKPGKNILLFDGVCNLCNGLVRFIIKRDKKAEFKFASLQSAAAQQLMNDVGLSGLKMESVVLIQGDHYYLKSTAVLKMLRELGGAWSLFYVFIWIPRPVRDFIYDLIAKSRYKIFGKQDSCMIPTPEQEARFLQ